MSEKVTLCIKWAMVVNKDEAPVKAYNILSKYRIPFDVAVDTRRDAKPVPIVIHGSGEYVGLEQIKEFAKNWQKNQDFDPIIHVCNCNFGKATAED